MHSSDLPTAALALSAANAGPEDSRKGSENLTLSETPSPGTIATAEEIPDKLYFRIGDVAKLAGIKPYVLRFWETEFPTLGPKKSGTGHRLYRRKDVQLVFDIKQLLYEKRFTIEGARKFLENRAKSEPPPVAAGKRAKTAAKKPMKVQAGLFDVPTSALDTVRKELTEILQILK